MKEGWKYTTIGESCNINYGTRVVRSKDGGTIYDVYGGGGATFKMDTYNREDCLVVARFAMSKQCTRYVKGKFFLNDSGLTVSPKDGSNLSQTLLDKILLALNDTIYSFGRGSAQRNLNIKEFSTMKIAYPINLAKQEKFVSLLDAEFAKIDAIKANAEKQYGNTMALYKSALKDLLTPADDWKDSIINDVIDHGSNISYGIVQPGDNLTEGVPVVRPVDLILNETLTSTKHFKKTSESISQAYSRTILNGKEILMCVRGTTGVVSLSSTVLKGCNVTRGIVPFKISDDILRKFIFYTFQAPIAFDFIQQYTQGAALKQINIKDVKNIPISLPPSKSDIENIVNRLDAISHLCYKLKSNYFTTVTLCNDLKQSILKDIFG